MKFLRSLSVQVLLALVAGLAVGAIAAAYGGAGVRAVTSQTQALGALWLNALQMTVVPLIFAVLVTGIAQVSDAAATGRLAIRAVAWFLALLILSAVLSIVLTNGLLALWPVDAAASAALRAGAQAPAAGVATAPDLGDWLRSLAPPNVLKAASEDQILPLVVFATFMGFAITRLPEARARQLVDVVQAIGDAMIVVVRWVLMAAPVGVFCLGLGVGVRAGAAAAGVLGHYVVTAVAAGVETTVIAYAMGMLMGGVRPGRWAQATAPVLATAFATQSSLACLPAMIERTRDDLDVPPQIANLVLPLAVAVFRFTSPAVNLAVCIFVAKVYGIHPTALQYVGTVFVSLAMSIGSVGLPGQVSFIISIAPICFSLGLPIDLLPILLAVEVAPDIFRTLGNVAGDMGVTAILARRMGHAAAARQA